MSRLFSAAPQVQRGQVMSQSSTGLWLAQRRVTALPLVSSSSNPDPNTPTSYPKTSVLTVTLECELSQWSKKLKITSDFLVKYHFIRINPLNSYLT